jgi:hypothetical protein
MLVESGEGAEVGGGAVEGEVLGTTVGAAEDGVVGAGVVAGTDAGAGGAVVVGVVIGTGGVAGVASRVGCRLAVAVDRLATGTPDVTAPEMVKPKMTARTTATDRMTSG